MSNRKSDHLKNELMNSYLDSFLYSKELFSNMERVYSRERQMLGVDVEFDFNGRHYVCDEKAATDYVNRERKLNTFCLELSSIQGKDKVEREGWLTNDANINNSYIFVWIDKAKDTDILECGIHGIEECEICLVRKERILEYLSSLGWTKERLRRKCYNIRNCDDTNLGNIKKDGCKFSYSEYNKEESPINVLLTREVYRSISDYNTILIK